MLYSRRVQKTLLLFLVIAISVTLLVVRKQQDLRNRAQTAYWRPNLVTSWQMQYTGLPIDQTVDAQVFNIDLFDNDAGVVASLHAGGKRVMCYFSAGSWEDWRPDAGNFPDAVKGQNLADWPGERWLDIRNLSVLEPLMEARMDMCRQKGFDAIDPDNIDAYTHNTGFPLTYQDQIQFNTFLANAAHARGMSIGLKNDVDQIADLVSLFDWQLNEQCFEFNECEKLLPFIQSGKPVFNVEYNLATTQFCPQANSMNFNSIRKNLALDVYREACRTSIPPVSEPILIYAPASPNSAQNPTFSPDGNILLFTVFHSGYNQGTAGIFKLAVDGTTPQTLLDEANQSSVNLPGASWNAQTNRITFASDRQDTDEVWTMAADGSGVFRVTRTPLPGYAIEPSFSPDGQWIVFERGTTPPDDTQQGSIYKIRADGTSLTQLTNGPVSGRDDHQPNWSPRGDRILFQRRTPGSNNWDIYTMTANGGDIVQVTNSTANDTDASFSSDGNWIVYSSDQGGLARPKLFIVRASGGTPTQVTYDTVRGDGAASFSPDGRWIAYESYPQDGAPASLWRVAAPVPNGPSANELLALLNNCRQISSSLYKTDAETSPTIPVCALNGAVYWQADMDVDCDGKVTSVCNSTTDPAFQPDTFVHSSTDEPLDASILPYVVIPSPSTTWDYRNHNIAPGAVVAVIYNGHVAYGIFADTGPLDIIGEASYAMASSLGIDPNPATGGVASGVSYIVFQGSSVSPVENHSGAVSLGQQLARNLLNQNGSTPTSPPLPTPTRR